MCLGMVGGVGGEGMCTRGSPVEIREQLYFWGAGSLFSQCFGLSWFLSPLHCMYWLLADSPVPASLLALRVLVVGLWVC